MLISGGLMIADRKLPKNRRGLPMKVSVIQGLAILFGVLLSWSGSALYAVDIDDSKLQFILFSISAVLLIFYVVSGPRLSEVQQQLADESE
jgi:membrane protein implicated in regulation of membrane protease activity